jgi:hypothetical protein
MARKRNTKRTSKDSPARRGNCYVTCEALFHLLGGYDAGYVPHRLRHEGDTHWYLVKTVYARAPAGLPLRGSWEVEKRIIIDPTVSQFKTRPDYDSGVGCGFLTKGPSKRAREMMERMVWQ